MALALPSIKYMKKIYIYREYPEITLKIISNEELLGTLTTITPMNYKPPLNSSIKFHALINISFSSKFTKKGPK